MDAFIRNDVERDYRRTKCLPSERPPGHDVSIEFGNARPLFNDAGSDSLRISLLARAMECEIIPRLMLAHRTPYQCLAFPDLNDGKIATMDVEAFAKLVLLPDESLARAYVEAVCASRIPLAIIYVVLLGPTARYLGELWENDLCDFTEVSLGLGRLQRLVHEFSPAHGPSVGTIANGRSILLLPSPGDQHSFGLVMLGELFRCAGWDVSGGPAELSADPERLVHHAWYDIVGFSVGCEANVATVSEAIRTVRKASMNQRVGIMVGGPIFAVHPEYAKRFEADICTNDGRHAPVLAEKFVSNLEALSD